MKQLVEIAAVFALLGSVEAVAAQSLGEIAKREADRRKHSASGKLYTNSDVRPEPRPAVVETAVTIPDSVAASAPEPAKQPEKSSSSASAAPAETAPVMAKEHRDETYWRTRAGQLRAHIQRLRDDIAAVETRQLELEEEPDAAPEYDVASGALTKLRRNLDAFTGELARFEERARAAKVPAEWLR